LVKKRLIGLDTREEGRKIGIGGRGALLYAPEISLLGFGRGGILGWNANSTTLKSLRA
jgi:hypothetical protein